MVFWLFQVKEKLINSLNDTQEKLFYLIQYKNFLKLKLGSFWAFPYVYTIIVTLSHIKTADVWFIK